jgi:hypothetical protein
MNNPHDRIEAYLLGELHGAELTAFEQALQQDQQLATAVADHRQVLQRLEGMRVRGVVQSALMQSAPPSAGRSWWWILFLVACGAGLLVFLFAPNLSKSKAPLPAATTPSEPVAQTPVDTPASQVAPELKSKGPKTPTLASLAKKYQAKPSATLLRSVSPAKEKSVLEQAQEAYHQGLYRQTLQLLEGVPDDEDTRYYRANALFGLSRFAEAETAYQSLETSFQYRDEARWNRFLCRLGSGKMTHAQARGAAEKLAADKEFEFREKAASLVVALSEQ